jgi:hypothetical protein
MIILWQLIVMAPMPDNCHAEMSQPSKGDLPHAATNLRGNRLQR